MLDIKRKETAFANLDNQCANARERNNVDDFLLLLHELLVFIQCAFLYHCIFFCHESVVIFPCGYFQRFDVCPERWRIKFQKGKSVFEAFV